MVETLEHRTLLAANTVASVARTGHTLNVVGTNESDHIHIGIELAQSSANPKELVSKYVVFVNEQRLAGYEYKIDRVNVYALGGNDRIEGLDLPASAMVDARNGQMLSSYDPASLYVEGGSGNDRISGGLAGDTLKGGRGDDWIVDENGRNYLDGGQGDDFVSANDGVASGLAGPGSPAPRGTGDTIISEAGRDEVHTDELDHLQYTQPRYASAILDDSSGAIISVIPNLIID